MNHGQDEAGPSHAGTTMQRRPVVHHNPFSINFLLEFKDARVEAAYQQYMYKLQQAADTCLIIANLLAVAVACVKRCSLPTGSVSPTTAVCLLSGGQALFLLLLLIAFPAAYARNRGLVMGCTRMYRLAVWLACLHEPYPPGLLRRSLSMRLFLLSPAGGSVWLALFYPLPLLVHVLLLGVSTLVATWRSHTLQERLHLLHVSPEQLTQAYQQLSRFSKFFELPTGRLLQRWHVPELEADDQLWCMYAFVAVVYGCLLPLLLLFIKEVHFRVRFLSCLQPPLAQPQLTGVRSKLYSTTTAAVFLIATMVPCSWSLVQLASHYTAAAPGQLQLGGALFLLTVLALEVFMRFWLLAVSQLLLRRVVQPALLWLLLRFAGPWAQ